MFGKLATTSLIASKFQVQNKYIRSLDNFDEQLSRVDFIELSAWRVTIATLMAPTNKSTWNKTEGSEISKVE